MRDEAIPAVPRYKKKRTLPVAEKKSEAEVTWLLVRGNDDAIVPIEDSAHIFARAKQCHTEFVEPEGLATFIRVIRWQ